MRISTDDLRAELCRLADNLGRAPKVMDMEDQGAYTYTTYQERFGSWNEALAAADIERPESNFPISEGDLLEELQRVADEHGAPPTLDDVRQHSGVPSTVYEDQFDSFDDAVRAAGFDPNATPEPQFKVSDEELRTALQDVAAELDHPPQVREAEQHTQYNKRTYYRFGDSWPAVLEAAGLDPDEKPSGRPGPDAIPAEELIDEIHRLAEEYSKPPTLQELKTHGEYSMNPFTDRFGSWQDALEAAGYEPRPATTVIPDEELLSELQRLADDLDTVPTTVDMTDHGKHNEKTYRRRFGTWGEALEAAGLTESADAGEPGPDAET